MQPIIKTSKYHNGQIRYQIPYVNGKVHGTALYWHPNGQLQSQIPYVNDQKHGTALWWLKNGQLAYQIPYVNDQRHGTALWWYNNGKLAWLDLYRSGNMLLEIKLLTKHKQLPNQKPLFDKSQFKLI